MIGAEVRDLQFALNGLIRVWLHVDVIFGPRTEAAVRTFQTLCHLAADGIVEKNTGQCLTAAALCNYKPQMRAQMSLHQK